MNDFMMNGYLWHVKFEAPNSPMLVDRTGKLRVATTDPVTRTIYLSAVLDEDFLHTVLLHELGHCAMISYGLLTYLHDIVHPYYWIEAEEWICNFMADFGPIIFTIAGNIHSLD